ncbi:MAG TPA: hypothetical protein VGM73_00785 [Candidatus Didemnitutus sp.]|jgi:hypothetical protein
MNADTSSLPADNVADAVILGWVADFYGRTLAKETDAQRFLSECGGDFQSAAGALRLGFANRTLGAALAASAEGRALRTRLQTLGLFRADSGHEHLNGCLVFPLTDAAGTVMQLWGYRIAPSAMPRTLTLPGAQRGIFNVPGLSGGRKWLMCADPLDALALWCHGQREATAATGPTLNDDFRRLLLARKPASVRLFHGPDAAETARAEVWSKDLAQFGVSVSRALLPPGQSLHDVLRTAADPSATVTALLAQTESGAKSVSPAIGAPAAPALSPVEVAVAKHGPEETVLTVAERTYRVRGLARNSGYESLKVSLRIACGSAWHLDTIDLAQAKQRTAFVSAAAEETGVRPEVLKRDVGRVLLKLEELHEAQLLAQVAKKDEVPPMTEAERTAALAFLQAPNLCEMISEHAAACGVVGERTNVLAGYLGAVSRLLDHPLAIVVQSSSAAGKTTLMDAILAFVPPEARQKYSAMTGQSLFYLGRANLRNKILAIAEQEGAQKAAYALKLLQSEGELRLAATGRDEHTGCVETQSYVVTGPVMIFLTTTAPTLDDELQNRCVVLTVDESREQTERIHALQRQARTEAGLARKVRRDELLALHRNAQRLLQPLPVFNPYAEKLRFLSDQLRTRRDHEKYLLLIDALAVLFQHQRERRTIAGRECIVAGLDDIARANSLAHEILGRGLEDTPPQARRLLGLIQQMEKERVQGPSPCWRRRDLRAFTGWSDTALKVHLGRLVDLEYVLPRRDPKHGFSYELLYDGDAAAGKPHLSGLLDVEELRKTSATDDRSAQNGHRSGQNEARSGSGQPVVSPRSGSGNQQFLL